MKKNGYVEFTKEMKESYTILAPNMLSVHFNLILQVFRDEGYKIDLLSSTGTHIAETGLKYVHNDTCYPAILVIGQFIDAIQSGKYDPHKVALIYFQTGGGCRASNYISLLRKALIKAGYPYIPVISFSFASLEKHRGFKLTLPIAHRLVYACIYGDLILSLVNQTKPYELNRGDADALAAKLSHRLAKEMKSDGVSYRKCKKKCREIVSLFLAIPQDRTKEKVKVGVVGEIYVKYSPLGNNQLEEFLVSQGAEAVFLGLLDFMLYTLYTGVVDYEQNRRGSALKCFVFKKLTKFLVAKQKDILSLIGEGGVYSVPPAFDHTCEIIKPYLNHGVKMGEGWLLPAEILELHSMNVKNIICTQPFGCLPNHIVGKGMMKPIRDRNPDINIVAIDYDASASRVNQENRVKLMLANAKEALSLQNQNNAKTEKAEKKVLITV